MRAPTGCAASAPTRSPTLVSIVPTLISGPNVTLSAWPSIVEVVGHTKQYDYIEFVAEYAPFDLFALENICRVIDTRNKSAVAQVEYSCDPINPGDTAIPFAEKSMVSFHPPLRFDRYLPTGSKISGRIVMSRDFDSELGTGQKIYMNVGTNQGVKLGDYFRAVRNYEADLKDPVDSLSFKAALSEDTQKKQASVDPNMFTKGNGPVIHVRNLPRRAVGEIVVIGTTPTTATGMIVFAMEDLHPGDGVELDEQAQAQ